MHTSLTNCVGFGHMNPLQDSQPLLAASSCGSCRCSSCVHAAHCNPWCRCGEEILTRSLVHTQRVSALSPRYSVSSGVKFLRTSGRMLSLVWAGWWCYANTSGRTKTDFDSFSISACLLLPVVPCKLYFCYAFFQTDCFFQKYFCNSAGWWPFSWLALLLWNKWHSDTLEHFSYRHCCTHIPA